MRRKLIGRAEIDHMLRSAALRKRAGVLHVSVPGLRKLPVKIHAGLAGQVSPCSLRWPHQGEHAGSGPVFLERMRPGKLDRRIIAMAGYCIGACRKADRWDHRDIESTAGWSKLLFETQA